MKLKLYPVHRSSLGIDANIVAGLIYIIPGLIGLLWEGLSPYTFIFPILLYFFEKKSDLVRFHALQYLTLSLANNLINVILYFGSLKSATFLMIAYYLESGILFMFLGFLIHALVKAFCWRSWRVPFIGALVSKIIGEEIDQ